MSFKSFLRQQKQEPSDHLVSSLKQQSSAAALNAKQLSKQANVLDKQNQIQRLRTNLSKKQNELSSFVSNDIRKPNKNKLRPFSP